MSRRRLLLILLPPLAGLLLLAALRAWLWLRYPGDFGGLAPGQVAAAFLRGLRFDAWVLAAALGPSLLALALPPAWAGRRAWVLPWAWLAWAALLAAGLVAAGDVIYFGHVHRHVGQELVAATGDAAIASALLGDHLAAIAVALVLALGSAAGWWWFLRGQRPEALAPRWWWAWGLLAVLLGLTLRGSLTRKPLHVVDAFAGASIAQGYLALNGPFVAARTLGQRGPATDLCPPGEALAAFSALVGPPADPAWPLERQAPTPGGTPLPGRRNLVIVMLESFGGDHVDSCRQAAGKPPLGLTPEFDRLAGEGWFLSACYANGQRSMEGMAAILGSVPTLPGLSFLGEGLEQTRLAWMGHLAQANGWSTVFVQGSKRASFRVDAISKLTGFASYDGAEDIPLADPAAPPEVMNSMGAWDDDTLQHLLRRLDAAPKPVFGFGFTLTTHGPYQLPTARWRHAPPGDLMGGYADTLRYADWALGRFVAGLRQRDWGRDCVVVLVADHTSGVDLRDPDSRLLHHIPLLILAPELEPRRDGRVCSQVDLLPTLADLLGWRGTWAGIGRSLCDPSRPEERGALCVRGDLACWIAPGGWVAHQGRLRVAAEGDPALHQAWSQRLLGLQQLLGEGFAANRVVRE